MTRSKGLRNRSRSLLRKPARKRGLPSPAVMLRRFSVGEKVVLDIEPSVHKGMPHRRFQGKIGEVVESRGRSYVIKVPMHPEERYLTVRPAHLKRFGSS